MVTGALKLRSRPIPLFHRMNPIPTPKDFYESPRWVPILMITLLAIGVLAILSRYVIWDTTNTPVLIGLGFLLAGLWVATKWR